MLIQSAYDVNLIALFMYLSGYCPVVYMCIALCYRYSTVVLMTQHYVHDANTREYFHE